MTPGRKGGSRLTSDRVTDKEDGLGSDLLGVSANVGRHGPQTEDEGAWYEANHDPEAGNECPALSGIESIEHAGADERNADCRHGENHASIADVRGEEREYDEGNDFYQPGRALEQRGLEGREPETSDDQTGELLLIEG